MAALRAPVARVRQVAVLLSMSTLPLFAQRMPADDTMPIAPVPGSASTSPVLKTASGNPMQYYLSVPRDWPGHRQWPVLVTITGSDKTWLSNATAYAYERNTRNYPFVLVTPLVLTNTGTNSRKSSKYSYSPAVWDSIEKEGDCAFDEAGVEAIMTDLARRYGAERTYFLTGYSGGGHLTMATVLLHPERLRAAVMASPNYTGRCVTDASAEPISHAPERSDLPIRFFLGSTDQFAGALVPQVATAIQVAQAHGYMHVSKVTLTGFGHEPMIAQTLSFFNSLLGLSER